MKKKVIIIGGIILFFVLIGLYCYSKDNMRFKFSYELVNRLELSNGKKIKVKIPLDNRVKYIKEDKLIELLENGTGIVYMGYDTCPWCRNAVPILIDSVRDNDVKKLYYVDIHGVKLSKVRNKLVEEAGEYLREDDEGNKVISVPAVFVVKKGEILAYHIGTVEGYKNPYKSMTSKQKKQLKKIYDDMIKELK